MDLWSLILSWQLRKQLDKQQGHHQQPFCVNLLWHIQKCICDNLLSFYGRRLWLLVWRLIWSSWSRSSWGYHYSISLILPQSSSCNSWWGLNSFMKLAKIKTKKFKNCLLFLLPCFQCWIKLSMLFFFHQYCSCKQQTKGFFLLLTTLVHFRRLIWCNWPYPRISLFIRSIWSCK